MKPRLLIILLLIFATWPLAHFFVVRALNLDPWKFGGWAMYSVPKRSVTIRMSIGMGDQVQYLDTANLSQTPGNIASAYQREIPVLLEVAKWRGAVSVRQRMEAGGEPRGVADAVFEAVAPVDRVIFAVTELELDPSTGRAVAETFEHIYRRDPSAR